MLTLLANYPPLLLGARGRSRLRIVARRLELLLEKRDGALALLATLDGDPSSSGWLGEQLEKERFQVLLSPNGACIPLELTDEQLELVKTLAAPATSGRTWLSCCCAPSVRSRAARCSG